MENLKVLDNIDSTLYGKNILPEAGTILMFAGNTAPSGWLLCNGSSYNTTDNPKLFTILGASTVPDLRSKYLLGANVSKTATNISGHVHNASFAAVNSNSVSVDGAHGHNANTTQATNYVNALHGHYFSLTVEARYVFNSGNKQGTNQGNLSNTDHQHFANVASTYGRNIYAPHSHTVANQSVAATNGLSHSHTVAATSGSASIFGSTSDLKIPKTKYLNYIIKGG